MNRSTKSFYLSCRGHFFRSPFLSLWLRLIGLKDLRVILMMLFISNCGNPLLPQTRKKVKLTEKEVAAHLKLVGFSDYIIPTMVCVAKHESKLRVDALNRNENGSTDHGLFQINDAWWLSECGVGPEGLKDPLVNIRCAKTVFDRQGLMAWYGYQKHWAACNNYKISEKDNAEWADWYPGPVKPKLFRSFNSQPQFGKEKSVTKKCNEKKLRACLVTGKGWACFNRYGCKSSG